MSNININRLNPYQLHKHLINEYYLKKRGDTKKLTRDTSKDKTDYDVIRENHKFLWETDETPENLTWEKKLAKRYYDKLFKEYCICDLSRYRENKVALRWRVEKEVIDGKGQILRLLCTLIHEKLIFLYHFIIPIRFCFCINRFL